jgi:hypothetical protein
MLAVCIIGRISKFALYGAPQQFSKSFPCIGTSCFGTKLGFAIKNVPETDVNDVCAYGELSKAAK